MSYDTVGIIGAGAVGRGLIAPVMIESGKRVEFFDVDPTVTEELRERTWYPLVKGSEVRWVGPVKAMHISNRGSELAGTLMADHDILFVSVKAQNLKSLAPTLKVAHKINPTITIVIVENMQNARETLSDLSGIPIEQFRNGIANVVVPVSEFQKDDPLYTVWDTNMELVIANTKAVDWARLDFPSERVRIIHDSDFEFEWDMKMYQHCSMHALAAYVGMIHGYQYIHSVLQMGGKQLGLYDAMSQITKALQLKYYKENDLHKYNQLDARASQEWNAMCDAKMQDTVARVGREPFRKLYPNERLFGIHQLLRDHFPAEKTPDVVWDSILEATRRAINSTLTPLKTKRPKEYLQKLWSKSGFIMTADRNNILDHLEEMSYDRPNWPN